MATSIGNIAINVSDLDRSERFYVDVLGLEVLNRIETPDVKEVLRGFRPRRIAAGAGGARRGRRGRARWRAVEGLRRAPTTLPARSTGRSRPVPSPWPNPDHLERFAVTIAFVKRSRRPPGRARPAAPLRPDLLPEGTGPRPQVGQNASTRRRGDDRGHLPPTPQKRRPPVRTSAKAIATRAALVELAARLFATRGYLQTSIRDIARDANLTTGAIYGHFRNKADLLAEAISSRTDHRSRVVLDERSDRRRGPGPRRDPAAPHRPVRRASPSCAP